MDVFSVVSGDFGRIEIVRYSHDLVMHAHPQTHFCFWLSGGTAHSTTGNAVTPIDLRYGVGINSLVSHDLCLDHHAEPAVFLMLYLENAWLDGLLEPSGQAFWLAKQQICISPEIQLTCQALLQTIGSKQHPYSDTALKQALLLVTYLVGLSLEATSLANIPVKRKLLDYRLRLAMTHMHEHLDSPSVVEDVASLVGLSRSRFFELFYAELQTSPHVYWNTLRIEEATKRLSQANENLTEVALDLGFSTSGNFSRFFRSHTGVTPSCYRRVSYVA